MRISVSALQFLLDVWVELMKGIEDTLSWSSTECTNLFLNELASPVCVMCVFI